MAKGYWIARVDVRDPERYKDYIAAAKPAFEKYGASFLARGGTYQKLEGPVRARNVAGALMLTIEDNGCGIPKTALGKLGRPFEQVQNQFSKNHTGSGLGLAISRSLAQLHGGALKIRSKEGTGTIVSVRIPTRQPETKGKAAAKQAA